MSETYEKLYSENESLLRKLEDKQNKIKELEEQVENLSNEIHIFVHEMMEISRTVNVLLLYEKRSKKRHPRAVSVLRVFRDLLDEIMGINEDAEGEEEL